MQGATPSMSSNTFQASAGGSGTSNELSYSMGLDLSAVADHLGRAEALPDPMGAGKEPPVVMALSNKLDTDRQSVGAPMGRDAQGRYVQDGPDRLKARIAGLIESARCFAVDAWSEQHVDVLEYDRQLRAARFGKPQCSDVVLVRHGASELDALAQALADQLAICRPFMRHRRRALVIVDGLAGGVTEA